MESVRFGIIGMGTIGKLHAGNLLSGKIKDASLTAVCDIRPELLAAYKEQGISAYESAEELFKSGSADCVIIATPHYLHPSQTIAAFKYGLHVVAEKPTGVYTRQVKEMNEAADHSGKLFSAMFCMRTRMLFRKMKELVESGAVGEIKRINWIMTDWYRSQSYYDSGSWRATWAGEGGGVMLNQCPHNMDLLLWITGMMPKKVTSKCFFGKWHDIEVEDDVSAFFEYENGATGIIVASTADTPGTNRFEVIGNNGKLVFDKGSLILYKLEQPEREFNRTNTKSSGEPARTEIKFENTDSSDFSSHSAVLQNVTNAVLGKEALYIDGRDGIKECMLANSILLSSWLGREIEMPFDDNLYYNELKKRVESSVMKEKRGTLLNLFSSDKI